MQALSLLEHYHHSKTAAFKYKVEFYGPCLRTLLTTLHTRLLNEPLDSPSILAHMALTA